MAIADRRRQRRAGVMTLKSLARGASPIAVAVVAAMSQARAQEAVGALEEIVVTAQKRTEDVQRVPVSVTAIGSEKLEQLHVQGFDDYVRFLPSVTSQGGGSGGGASGPSDNRLIIRGVSSDSNLNHSGPLPTVGTYLDEQPITTIQGALNLHLYDIARVEALAGPQGTLYGASSEAGTVRIITNKPDPSGFKAGFEIEGNTLSHGDPGSVLQGFVNVPLSERAAVRLVGWAEHDGGYVDNVHAVRTYSDGAVSDNAPYAKDKYNDVSTYGARAALKVDLNKSWTVTPVVIAQKTKWNGFFAYNPSIGDLQVKHFSPDLGEDKFTDLALTLEGKLSNFDLIYTGAFLKRDDATQTDYSDYSLAYDLIYPSYTAYIVDNSGSPIDPTQRIVARDGYTKMSHEIRLTSPSDRPLRYIVGAFYQRHRHDITQDYQIAGLAQSLWVTGWQNTWWLTQQRRIDVDKALFGELNYDLTDKLTATVGMRFFKYDNQLGGFRGFGLNNPVGINLGLGESANCDFSVQFRGAPCLSFQKSTTGSGNSPKLTLAYRIDDERMVYVTYSKGFRPGGINRVGDRPPYTADYLKNYEVGWKTSWAGKRLRFNGAFFREDWDNFQFSFVTQPASVTQIANAAAARVTGVEATLDWAATAGLTLSAGISLLDPKLTQNYCGTIDLTTGQPFTDCADPLAPSGTQLPGTSKTKANLIARYNYSAMGHKAFLQGAYVYQSSEWPDLRIYERTAIGQQPGFGTLDLSAGVNFGPGDLGLYVSNLTDERGQAFRFQQCSYSCIEATYQAGAGLNYIVPTKPRSIALRYTYTLK